MKNPNAPGAIEALTTITRDEEKDQTWTYSLQADGPLCKLPGGKLAAGFGAERREEHAEFPLRTASDTTTAGLIAEIPATKGLSLSFDWFGNVYQDRIATLLFNQMALLYPKRITRGARLATDPAGWAGVVTAVDLRPINVGTNPITGYDLGVKCDRRLAWGEVQTALTATKYPRNASIPTPGGAPSPTVNTDSLPVFNVLNRRPPFDDLVMPDNTIVDSRLPRYALSLRRTF